MKCGFMARSSFILLSGLFFFGSCVDNQNLKGASGISDPSELVVAKNILWKPARGEDTVKLNVVFLNGSQEFRQNIKRFAPIWSKYANVDFTFYESLSDLPWLAKAHITIKDHGGSTEEGTYKGTSHVGTNSLRYGNRSGNASMNYWLPNDGNLATIKGVILHEFGHALGLQHEHQHAERTFTYNFAKLQEDCAKANKSWEQCQGTDYQFYLETFGTDDHDLYEYDPASIMHYGLGRDMVINADEEVFTSSNDLSLLDKVNIAKVYPGRAQAEEIIAEHAQIAQRIESTNRIGHCEIYPYTVTDGRTFYSYRNTLIRDYSRQGHANKSGALFVMENDPRCAPSEESNPITVEEFNQSQRENGTGCSIVPAGSDTNNPYIDRYTKHKNQHVVLAQGQQLPLGFTGFDTVAEAFEFARHQNECGSL